jgi:hypothetical protein
MTVSFRGWSVHAVRRWMETANDRMYKPDGWELAITQMKKIGTTTQVEFAQRVREQCTQECSVC